MNAVRPHTGGCRNSPTPGDEPSERGSDSPARGGPVRDCEVCLPALNVKMWWAPCNVSWRPYPVASSLLPPREVQLYRYHVHTSTLACPSAAPGDRRAEPVEKVLGAGFVTFEAKAAVEPLRHRVAVLVELELGAFFGWPAAIEGRRGRVPVGIRDLLLASGRRPPRETEHIVAA